MAKQMGEKAEAKRLFDRAMVEFEKKSGNKAMLVTPNGFPGVLPSVA